MSARWIIWIPVAAVRAVPAILIARPEFCKSDRVEDDVTTRATAWVDSLHLAYMAADEQIRRLLNQAIFKRVYIGLAGLMSQACSARCRRRAG